MTTNPVPPNDQVLSKSVGCYNDSNSDWKHEIYAARYHTLDDMVPYHLRRVLQVLVVYTGDLIWINLSDRDKQTLKFYD